MRDFMTLWFSHPRTVGILMWGFWEGAHWRPRAALWARDWRLKPCGQAWLDLVTKEWTTNVAVRTDAQGRALVRGFLGDYHLSATGKGLTASTTVSLSLTGAEARLVLER